MNGDPLAQRIAFFTLVGHAVTHMFLMLFPPLLGLLGQDLGMDTAGVTFYYTVVNVFFGLGAAPAGWLAGRLGDKPLLVAFFVGSALGGALVGLAHNAWMLGAGAVVLGLATSIYHPVGTALVSKGGGKWGRAMGINGVAGSVGVFLGPLFVFGVLRLGLTWRWAFLLLAIPTLILGAWLQAVDLGPAASPRKKAESPGGGSGARGRRRLPLEKAALLIALLSAMTLAGFTANLIFTLLPQLLATRGGLSGNLTDAEAGALKSGIVLVFGAVGQYVSGLLCDRWEQRRLYVLAYVLAVPLVLAMAYAQGAWLLAAACGASTFVFGLQPIENTLLARFSLPEWRSLIYGAKFILVFGLGGMGNWAAGLLSKLHGLPSVYQAGAISAALALTCAVAALGISVRPTGEERREPTPSGRIPSGG